MDTKVLAVIAVGVLLVGGIGAAFVTGFGPAPGGDSGQPEITDFPTATGTPYGGGEGTATTNGTDGAAEPDLPPFTFEIQRIEECGETCRDVTTTLYNNQNESASNVVVYTRIYVGNSTAEDDRIWQGKEDVGTLGANESYTTTKRVELSLSEGYQVKQHDGLITIVTTVDSADRTVTFKEHRDVA